VYLRAAPADARALNELGIVCKYTGRFDEGRELYERALALVPPDSAEAAAILHNLGGIEHARGRHAEAEGPAWRAVEIRTLARGADHVDVAADRAPLAAIVDGLGRTDEAEALLREALAVFERAREHHEVGVTLANLAAIAHKRGDHAGAERLHRRALTIREATLGGDHPELAITLANLATTLRAAGRPDEAVRLDRRAHALLDGRVAPDHPTLALVRSRL
jgi:Flp pilus assembly protein TadD